jgi:hypothetical protein
MSPGFMDRSIVWGGVDRRPEWNESVRRTTTVRAVVLAGAKMSAGLLQ